WYKRQVLAEVFERVPAPQDLGPESAMRMGEVVSKISEATGNKAIVVTDVGQNQMMSARYSNYTIPKSMITSGGLGTMGFCLPAAIGAKLADPGREVLAYMGDGGFQMTMQELGTILEYRVGVKIILLNNNYLGNVRQWQAMFYNNRFSATPMVNPDFIAIAAAYGIPAENVSCRAELDEAIARMSAHDGAYMLNVNIDPTDMVFPMVTPGSAIDNILIITNDKYEA
ncbi:MAG: acetolactate synthase large subunit, partial [Duncaniella sp.]|nr:acetolactate synthase large subunit [Duncaniella sp.]